MPTICRCPNIGNCDKADRRELITIPDGADRICPDCRAELVPTRRSSEGRTWKKIAVGVIVVLLIGTGWFLWSQMSTPPSQPTQASSQHETPVPLSPPQPLPPAVTRDIILRIHGSNTVGSQLVPELAKAFLQQKGARGVDQVSGQKAQEFFVQGQLDSDAQPEAIEIHAHGSTTAFADLKSGVCDIGMSSRKVTAKEVADLGPILGDLSSNASEHVLALDGLAVVVHQSNPVKPLTVCQVAAIFAGETANWSQVGGTSGAVTLYARDDNSGTFEFFRDHVLRKCGKTLASQAQRFENSKELSDKIAQDPQGIGFIGLPYVGATKVLALHDAGTPPLRPSELTVRTEDYVLSRRLYLYTGVTPRSPYEAEFIKFALSDAGQIIVKQVGFVGLSVHIPQQPSPPNPDDPRAAFQAWRRLTQGAVELPTRFRFRAGKSELDALAHRDIGRIVGILSQSNYTNARLILIGFADSTGSKADNERLSRDRAQIVERELRTEGLNIDKSEGLGQEASVASNNSPEDRERNRRVEIWMKK